MKKESQKEQMFTESDIKHLAQAFDILLEGAIQNHLIDEHGKLTTTNVVVHDKTGGGDD